jgi:hypothetical protein
MYINFVKREETKKREFYGAEKTKTDAAARNGSHFQNGASFFIFISPVIRRN